MGKIKNTLKSVRIKLFFTICIVITMIILLLVIVNNVVLEKFYLYYTNKIDLYSFEQQKDNYKTYLEILKKFNSNIC